MATDNKNGTLSLELAPGVPFNQPAQQPQPRTDLPAVLAALGGLGLNIAGAFTGAGAVGNQTLNAAGELQAGADARARKEYENQVRQDKERAQTELAQKLFPRVQSELPADKRPAAITSLQNRETDFPIAELNRQESMDRADSSAAAAERRRFSREDDREFNEVRRRVTAYLNQHSRQLEDTRKQFESSDPILNEYKKLTGIETLLSGVAPGKEPKNSLEFKAFLDRNAKSLGFKLSGQKEANELFVQLGTLRNERKQPYEGALGGVAKNVLGIARDIKPNDAYKDLFGAFYGPQGKQALQAAEAKKKDFDSQAQAVKEWNKFLLNPKHERKAVEAIASGNLSLPQRMFSKSANKYFLKWPDGSFTEE